MLYIQLNDGKSLPLHIGNPMPYSMHVSQIESIHADMDELDLIAGKFPALTPVNSSVGRWHGDIARTIVLNIMKK